MKESDEWQTPKWLFNDLNGRHGPFDIDLCATSKNSKCNLFYKDYLNDLLGQSKQSHYDSAQLSLHDINIVDQQVRAAFMNPPYSNPKPFIEKAWEDSQYIKIVCLVKCDPSTKWWSTFWDYEFGPKPGCQVFFFPKRIKFDPPQELIEEGTVWRERRRCTKCGGRGVEPPNEYAPYVEKCRKCQGGDWVRSCGACELEQEHLETYCRGKGYIKLSGPTFPSAVVVMDRRNI